MAYCSPRNSVGLFVKKGIIVDLFLIKRDPILGYEGTENYSVIVYFRGRNLSLKEWKKRDSVLIKYKIPEILRQKFKSFFVDRVWYKHVKAMIEEGKLFEKIEKLVMIAREVVHKQLYAQAVKVTFTGHGIGGAYATLAGALYKLNELLFYKQGGHQGLAKPFGDLMAIYTYGQPRVGDERFASFLNENSFISRVTHTNDYVSQFPVMSKEKRKYLHANFEYWISKIPCDCYDQKLDGYQLIRCDVFKLPGENPYCNRGQRYTKGSLANQGPYFGVTMGKCDKGMEDIII
ncbi:hypothetical protein G9A89_014335 [Geosiphon pyriformis]|nr:hypothetical protein G9A89_014335 [Geosiphon pyriformis]